MPLRREVSRVEGFSDAVFAFAITLLVVSLEVPKTFHELMATIRAFPTFAICYLLLFQVWWRHYRFFRKYDLEDNYVIALTGALLFVVLFYVYPLKFLWSLPFAGLEGRRVTDDIIRLPEVPTLFVIYGAGVVAVFTILGLLYAHAYRRRDQLGLSAGEALEARVRVYSNVGVASVGLLSIVAAVLLGAYAPRVVGIAGYMYGLIGVVEWLVGDYHGRQQKKLATATAAFQIVPSTKDTSPA